MKDFIEGEDPLDRSNVVAFPIDAKLARARQEYWTCRCQLTGWRQGSLSLVG